MTLSEINSRISFITGVGVTDYTYLDRTIALNKWYFQTQTWLLQAQDEWDFDDLNNTTVPVATSTLTAQNSSLPSGALRIKRVELSYNGGTTYYKASPIDIPATAPSQTETTYSQTQPYYDTMANTISVYPAPSVSAPVTIKIWIDRSITPFTYTSEASNALLTGTAVPGIDVNFHDLLALGAAHEWKYNKLKDSSLLQDIAVMKADIQKHYSTKAKDRDLNLASAYVDYE